MERILNSLVAASVLLGTLCASCGLIPPSLRKRMFETYPSFETGATARNVEKSSGIFSSSDSKYEINGAPAPQPSSAKVDIAWERVEDVDLTPHIQILGIDITDPDDGMKMKGLRLTIFDSAGHNYMEVVGVVQTDAQNYVSFPCHFQIFVEGQEHGSIDVHHQYGPSERRDFDFLIRGDTMHVETQTSNSESISYAVTTPSTLVGFMELKAPGLFSTTRKGEILLAGELDETGQSHVWQALLIADMFHKGVFNKPQRKTE